MLSDISGKQQLRIPHYSDYRRWRERLNEDDYAAIMDYLHDVMDREDVFNSSFLPGSDWTGTVFQPIYDAACNHDWDQSRLFYGLLVWEAAMSHESHWFFLARDGDVSPGVLGKTYFRRQ